jgi:hypothetical protein
MADKGFREVDATQVRFGSVLNTLALGNPTQYKGLSTQKRF